MQNKSSKKPLNVCRNRSATVEFIRSNLTDYHIKVLDWGNHLIHSIPFSERTDGDISPYFLLIRKVEAVSDGSPKMTKEIIKRWIEDYFEFTDEYYKKCNNKEGSK